MHAADQVVERRVLQQVVQRVAVRGADKLHAALGDGARSHRLVGGADFVNDDNFRHVVFHRFNHHRVLLRYARHLHAPRASDGGVGDVSIACNLVGSIHHHHALFQLIGQHARHFAQFGGLADARPAKDEDGMPLLHHVADDIHRAEYRAPHAAGEADDTSLPIADGGDAMQRARDARAVVITKFAYARHHILDVVL
ncbi:MAG: hypothetical protein BWY76_03421 [bacterium ADurb.Bin429]|nr:MAG: hypothetical protein BWY76_03421 [bacterium ADurb.Bin429]